MRVLGAGFVRHYEGRLINIHPALLPSFPGLDTHARALAAGVKQHGCTVHFVTAEVDAGPIIIQAAVNVRAGDTVKAGDVLGVVDSASLTNEYEQERATLASADAALNRQVIEVRRQILKSGQDSDLAKVKITAAEREFKRAEDAWNIHVIPERDFQRARDDLETAKLEYTHAVALVHTNATLLRALRSGCGGCRAKNEDRVMARRQRQSVRTVSQKDDFSVQRIKLLNKNSQW